MDKFYGFDLGDAESAIALLDSPDAKEPRILPVRDAKSFITAYAKTVGVALLIGEEACLAPDASERALRFKSRFLTDRASAKDIKSFAAGVLGELLTGGDLIKGEDSCFYIGCPAGWDAAARERYRAIFEDLNYPPARIISESRAALVAACQSRHLEVGYDILSRPVLVVDIGSSTTDFAYIRGGREVELKTAGEVALGGGLMDEMLLDLAVEASPHRKEIRTVFEASTPWRSYAEFAARRLKEKYFADEEYWAEAGCENTLQLFYEKPLDLTLRMDKKTADQILNGKCKPLGGRSFKAVFTESLRELRGRLSGELPELLFLTGGVSRLPAVTEWCREVFPEAVIIRERSPEFSVARGLSFCGRIDADVRAFRREVRELIDSTAVEKIVSETIDDLYMRAVDSLTGPILEHAVLPVIYRWRDGEIRRLSDIDAELETAITAYLHTDEAKKLLVKPVAAWLKPVSYALEDLTVPICTRHKVPYRALSLSSYLSLSEIDIRLDTKNVFAVDEMTFLIDTIISVIVGLLCGGSGVALVSSGPTGIIAGAVVTLLVLLLGKKPMQEMLLRADIPVPMRKLIPKKRLAERLADLTDDIRNSFYTSLEKEKNEEISSRMVREISEQIETCLMRMAEIVEVPLG
ncbi:MAG: Hsp70 family protein [Lachnospiraceae bacterium]|nr:Hsp70 family protein [Lachnospiraceae bacterium]